MGSSGTLDERYTFVVCSPMAHAFLQTTQVYLRPTIYVRHDYHTDIRRLNPSLYTVFLL